MTGLLVTIDGPGGVGKTTATAELTRLLRADGRRVHQTREPSDTPIGTFTRTHAETITGRALACLVAADRHHHLATEIRPRLQAGDTVVCDRYTASSLVLQQLDGVPAEYVLAVNDGADRPDLAVILIAQARIIRARLEVRGTRHRFETDPEQTERELLLYAQAAAILAGQGTTVLTIDASDLTPSGVASRIREELAEHGDTVGPHG